MAGNGVQVTVVGNLTKDPELRFTPSGVAVVQFSVAHNPRVYDRDSGEWKDGEPSFYRCQAWRQLAENVAQSLCLGHRVVLTGAIRQRRYEKDGQARDIWEITVDAIGPDLTYAQVQITKNARTHPGEAPPDDDWVLAAPMRAVA